MKDVTKKADSQPLMQPPSDMSTCGERLICDPFEEQLGNDQKNVSSVTHDLEFFPEVVEPTETIDLGRLFSESLSESGSFDIRGEIWSTTFGKVLQALPIPALLINSSLAVWTANEALGKIAQNYRAIQGTLFSNLFPDPNAKARITELLQEVFSTRRPRTAEGVMVVGGRRVWARLSLRSIRVLEERFVLLLVEDLTQEKRQLQENKALRRELEQRVAERTEELSRINLQLQDRIAQCLEADEALRSNQERLQAVLEHLPDLLWMKDLDGVFLLVNKAFARSCERDSVDEVIGKTDFDIWPEKLAELYTCDDWSVMEGRTSRLVEEPIIHHGTTKWFETFKTPMFDAEGSVIGTVGSSREITARKNAEIALRDSEEKYRKILETITDGYHEVDLEGNLTLVNDSLCEIMGHTRDELLGMNYRQLMDRQNAEKTFQAYKRVFETGESNPEFVVEIMRKDGAKRYCSVSLSLVRQSDETPVGFRGILRDITERRHLEEQLRQAVKMEAIGRMAGGIAHDFNNLLTAIMGFASMLGLRLTDDQKNLAMVQQISRAADRAAELIRQLLAFSRRQVLDVRVVSLNYLVRETENMLRRLIGEDIELVTVLDPAAGNVRADPTQIEQIVLNLAVNARDAMPGGGSLRIETRNVYLDGGYANSNPDVKAGHYVLLSVGDTGHGMDSETCSRVFDPFFTTKDKGVGTGLGLSTVYGIVKQHEGHISVYSELACGTTFKVYLPRVDQPLVASGPPARPEQFPEGTETILLVEDESSVRETAAEALQMLGYAVLAAASPSEAKALASEHSGQIHLLLTDVVLPQMDGRSLFEDLVLTRPQMRVLYVSGYTENFIVHSGVLDPHVSFLPKPFTLDSLARKVREVLFQESAPTQARITGP